MTIRLALLLLLVAPVMGQQAGTAIHEQVCPHGYTCVGTASSQSAPVPEMFSYTCTDPNGCSLFRDERDDAAKIRSLRAQLAKLQQAVEAQQEQIGKLEQRLQQQQDELEEWRRSVDSKIEQEKP